MAINILNPAIELIKSFEGIMDGDPTTVNLDPYLCPANFWTIGWGHIVRDKSGNALRFGVNKVKAYSVYPHGITMKEAESLLMDDVKIFVNCVDSRVTVPINNNQRCALVSFAFNVGCLNFTLSTLLKVLNRGEYDKVPDQLLRWNKSAGRVLNGLTRRRKAEAKLWNTAI